MTIQTATTEPDLQPLNALATMVPSACDSDMAREACDALAPMAEHGASVGLTITGTNGKVRLPALALQLLVSALSEMARGNAVSLTAMPAEVTTQQAAELLDVSRPYLVGLLEKGAMPFRTVGVQRRIRLRDLMDYKERWKADRSAALDELARLSQELGLYDA